MALRADERPALTTIEGGRQDTMSATFPYPQRHDPIGRRRELQELIDSKKYGLSANEIDAYADALATRFPGTDAIDRALALHMLAAYMDGWLKSYDMAYQFGLTEGYEFTLLMIKKARCIYGEGNAALHWVHGHIAEECAACGQKENES